MPRGTRIHYMYRDAGNYKFYGFFDVEGEVRRTDLEPFLFDREWFVPMTIGLPHLLNMPINENDHMLHELQEFEVVEIEDAFCKAGELIESFKSKCEMGWFSCFL